MAYGPVLEKFYAWCEHERVRSISMLRQYEAGVLHLQAGEPDGSFTDISQEAITNHRRIIKEMGELLDLARTEGVDG